MYLNEQNMKNNGIINELNI